MHKISQYYHNNEIDANNARPTFKCTHRIEMIQQVTMKSTKASLTETIQYLCRGKVLASETRELASVSRGKIRPGEGEEWLNEQMYVPPLPPTNLRGCHLINVLYHVYVSINAISTAITIITTTCSMIKVSYSLFTLTCFLHKANMFMTIYGKQRLSSVRFFFLLFSFSVMKISLLFMNHLFFIAITIFTGISLQR